MNLPPARTADLVEQKTGAETMIYDLRVNKAFLLNETSKNVFNACAEGISFNELKRRHRYSDDLIHFALDQLRDNGLIESETPNHFSGLSRREAVKRVGFASMAALPVIYALIAPTSANAASGCPPPNGSNIPSNCPVGNQVTDTMETCAGRSDAGRTGTCNSFYGGDCQTGSAVYAPNSCTNAGTMSNYFCVCN